MSPKRKMWKNPTTNQNTCAWKKAFCFVSEFKLYNILLSEHHLDKKENAKKKARSFM